MNEPKIYCMTKNNNGYLTIEWSRLFKADRHYVSTSVPSVAGIFELYRMDEEKKLNLLTVTQAWYGGLRSQIREAIEPTMRTNPEERALIEKYDLYCRYSVSNTLNDMKDALWFLHMCYFNNKLNLENSNRFKKIYVKEEAPDQIHWV